jgi:hypothetical protein
MDKVGMSEEGDDMRDALWYVLTSELSLRAMKVSQVEGHWLLEIQK